MTDNKRKIEVFTSGCPFCDETVRMVRELSCPSCNIIIYDLRESGIERAREYGVNSVPTVVVDGEILDCCKRGKPTREELKKAGIGVPL
jgi:glutaredoxin